MTDLCQLSARELIRLMSGGSVSCREVVQAHLARIDAVNPTLNALVEATDAQQCLAAADEADQRVARGAPLGRMHGLPIVVKDVMHVAGLQCSGGSPVLRAAASDDATAVSRLRAEGAIVLGLTNVPEMGRGGESNNNLYGRTNNPFDLSRTPGGSSGGSAALVSAGGAAFSVGSDGGGSIRQPCHNTGIAGIKPTHGRIPRTGSVFGDALGIFGPFNCYGPLARTAVVADAVRALTEAGGVVEHNAPPCLGRTMELLWESVFLGGDRGQGFEADLAAIGADEPSEELAEFLKQARLVDFSLSEARSRLTEIDTYRIQMLEFMADYDVIVGPAMPTAAKPHHHGLVEIADFSHLMAHNLTGWPAAVVRCGTSNEGLPVGVQIVARPWEDATALAVAGRLETALGGWRPPPLVA
jgi:amidase